MAGLLEVVVILWRSIYRSLESNKEAQGYTVSKFASVLPEYMKVFKVRLVPGTRATGPRRCRQPLDLLPQQSGAAPAPTLRAGRPLALHEGGGPHIPQPLPRHPEPCPGRALVFGLPWSATVS